MSEFDNVVPTFVRTESIHDLCSRQIARAIRANHWLSTTDSVMVRCEQAILALGFWLWNWFVFAHSVRRNRLPIVSWSRWIREDGVLL